MKWIKEIAFLVLGVSSLQAVFMREDVSEIDYLRKAYQSSYQSVGFIQSPIGVATGTLIDKKTVLTAAHTLLPDKPVKFFLLDPKTNTLKEVIGTVHIHENYIVEREEGRILNIAHDIALIYLEKPIDWVEPAKLEFNFNPDREIVFTGIGFGWFKSKETNTLLLDKKKRAFNNRFCEAPHISLEPCYLFTLFESPDDISCLPLEGIGTTGDSGGPIFVPIKNKECLVGILSLMIKEEGYYGSMNAILPIKPYKNWIQERLKRK